MLTRIRGRRAGRRRASERGLSVVELLVGVAVGLFVLGGVISLFISNLGSSRRLVMEARLNQDLRVVGDLITRDLRRAGYWSNAMAGTVVAGSAATPPRNPYQAMAVDAGNATVTYSFARDTNDSVDDNEQFGFRRSIVQVNGLDRGVIQMRTRGSPDVWQTLTDPNVVEIPTNGFQITVDSEPPIDLRDTCAKACVGTGCPTIQVRNYELVLTATSVADADMSRTLRTRVRVRNDLVEGACPA